MLKKVAAMAALVAGFSWATTASATAKPITDAQVETGVHAELGVQVHTYDLNRQEDVVALLSLIFGGIDVDASADVDADVDVSADVDAKAGVQAGAK